MKRVQSLVEVFQDYDCYEPAFAFGEDGMEEEKDSRVMQVCSNPRRVVVSLEGVCRVLSQPVQVTETIRWKMVRAVSRVSTSSRSDVVRGDPSRAQISSSAMQYYEKWADMDKEVAAAGENPKRLSTGDARAHPREGEGAGGERGAADARAERDGAELRRDSRQLEQLPMRQVHLAHRVQVRLATAGEA